MKKLLIALAMFAVAGASAQTKMAQPKAIAEEASTSKYEAQAQKNVDELTAVVPLKAEQKADMKRLFINKYRMLNESGELSAERKEYIAQMIGKKLEATFDADIFKRIAENKALYQSLTH